jgi:hypothetical protein
MLEAYPNNTFCYNPERLCIALITVTKTEICYGIDTKLHTI